MLQKLQIWVRSVIQLKGQEKSNTKKYGIRMDLDFRRPIFKLVTVIFFFRPNTPDPTHDKRDSSGSFEGSAALKAQSRKIHDLACAILQVAQMMDPKYLKEPLGEDEKGKKKRQKDEEKRKKVNYNKTTNTVTI